MSKQKLLILLLIVVIAIAAGVGYKALTKNKLPYNPPTEIPEDWLQTEPQPKTEQSTTPLKTEVKTPTSKTAYDETKVAACVASYRSKQQQYNQELSRGEILVGFPDGISADKGKTIIRSHSLTSRVPVSGFHFYLYADVPGGEEFRWACRLSQDTRIRYAEPNYIQATLQP